VYRLALDNNEAAFSIAVVAFSARQNELHLVVGTAQDVIVSPRSCKSGFLCLYKLTEDGAGLEFLHKVR
jgi:splicing factor 3B subunit 3